MFQLFIAELLIVHYLYLRPQPIYPVFDEMNFHIVFTNHSNSKISLGGVFNRTYFLTDENHNHEKGNSIILYSFHLEYTIH